MSLKNKIFHNISLIPGWHTTRKIVVIESDDWGTIRMTDKQTLEILSKSNPKLMEDPMNRFDSLESNTDLEHLLDTLDSVRDKNKNPAIITANTIVANPIFKKIKESNYQEYYYEPFTDTLKRFPNRENIELLIKQGLRDKLYMPQFHGREHVNVGQWLHALQKGHKELTKAFQYGVFGISLQEKISKRNNLMTAFDFENDSEKIKFKKIINEGIYLFERLFGFYSETFIATTYVWDSELELELSKLGIKGIQGIPFQYVPNPGEEWYKRKFHYTGQKNSNEQVYLVRNAYFEPSFDPDKDTIGECLKRIEIAFKWRKPAIISSHRLNFIGSLVESNRVRNLKLLGQLLKTIMKKWSDVEFMSSDELVKHLSFNSSPLEVKRKIDYSL